MTSSSDSSGSTSHSGVCSSWNLPTPRVSPSSSASPSPSLVSAALSAAFLEPFFFPRPSPLPRPRPRPRPPSLAALADSAALCPPPPRPPLFPPPLPPPPPRSYACADTSEAPGCSCGNGGRACGRVGWLSCRAVIRSAACRSSLASCCLAESTAPPASDDLRRLLTHLMRFASRTARAPYARSALRVLAARSSLTTSSVHPRCAVVAAAPLGVAPLGVASLGSASSASFRSLCSTLSSVSSCCNASHLGQPSSTSETLRGACTFAGPSTLRESSTLATAAGEAVCAVPPLAPLLSPWIRCRLGCAGAAAGVFLNVACVRTI